MPYYVYKITQPTPVMKNMEMLEQFDVYKDARNHARHLRSDMPANSGIQIKVMFASNQLEAEEQLQEKREQPILMEWEK
ncbi:MAG: hypothetical protein ACWA5U_09635 [bacterium]